MPVFCSLLIMSMIGERDLRLYRQAGMAAGEDQPEQVVADHFGRLRSRIDQRHGLRLLPGSPRFPADEVDRPPLGRDHEPAARILGHAVSRPRFERAEDSILGGVLGEVEAAGDAGQRGQHPGAFLAYQPGDRVTGERRHPVRTG
jgi:hypothetical protein